MHNRGLCVGNTVTSGRTERGGMVHKETETKSNVRRESEEECWSEIYGTLKLTDWSFGFDKHL